MKFALLRALKKLKAHRPYSIQWEYLRGNSKLRTFPFTSPFTGKRLVALWSNNQDLREIILAFDRNKWQSIDVGDPGVIVDLGSNNGYSGLYFKDRFPSAAVYLIDLLQSNTLFGNNLFDANGLHATHVNVAVSGSDGLIDVDLHPAHSRNRLSSLLDDEQKQHFGFSGKRIRVPSRRLTSLMEDLQIDHIDLMKVDIEGAEQYLIEDIANWSPFVDKVLLEIHHNIDTAWCEQKITDAGYSVFKDHSDWYLTK
jgi:FkbM family methyltransferase